MNARLAAELVRSLFCGLPRQEKRMAVFVSASDESAGPNQSSIFHYCGYVMPEPDWSNYFCPAWTERVLSGPPIIPFLHMTDIRRKEWRESVNISDIDADTRVQAACDVIRSMGSLFPVRSTIDGGKFRQTCGKRKWRNSPKKAAQTFDPDYLCFLGYVFQVLIHISTDCPDAEKVDFIVEKKGGITNHIGDFYESMPATLTELGYSHLVPLLGTIIPGDKERVPLQAADVLCWHAQRAELKTLDRTGMKRLLKLAKGTGSAHVWSDKEIEDLDSAFARRLSSEK